MPTVINTETLTNLLTKHRVEKSHRIFNVTFERMRPSKCGQRKAGDRESMNVMFGVRKHLKQEDGTYRAPRNDTNYFAERNLIGVYAVSRKGTIPGAKTQGGIGFRSIRIDTITSVTIDGEKFVVARD